MIAKVLRTEVASLNLQTLKFSKTFGYRTIRHQDTLGHFNTDLKTLRHECRDRGKAGTLRPRTIPMRNSSTGDSSYTSAPILWCRSVLWPKCPAPTPFTKRQNSTPHSKGKLSYNALRLAYNKRATACGRYEIRNS